MHSLPYCLLPLSKASLKEEDRCLYAFFLAIQALSEQRLTRLTLGDEILRRAELEIAQLSIDFFSNFYFSAACHHVSLYYSGTGNSLKKEYYLNQGMFYYQEIDHTLTQFEENLIMVRFFHSRPVMLEVHDFKNFVLGLPKVFYEISEKNLHDELPTGVWDLALAQTHLNKDNFSLFMKIMDIVNISLRQYRSRLMENVEESRKEMFFQLEDVHGSIVYEGVKFNFMKVDGGGLFQSVSEESAWKITQLTENELFP